MCKTFSIPNSAPACTSLISFTFSPEEVIPLIEAIFTTQNEVKRIGRLRGDHAQIFVDVIYNVSLHAPSFPRCGLTTFILSGSLNLIHQALDLPDLSPRLRKKCLGALCRVCGRQAVLPSTLQIPFCYDRLAHPLYRGGYADVWKGEHQGRSVAVLRVYSTSDFGKITSVGSHDLAKKLY